MFTRGCVFRHFDIFIICLHIGDFIIGRVIRAMQACWHPDCFRCEICNVTLADSGFVKNAGRYVLKHHHVNDNVLHLPPKQQIVLYLQL